MPKLSTIVAFYIGLVLKVILCGTSPTVNFPEEKISTFKEIAQHVKETLNLSADPCVDYYAYVCGNFNKSSEVLKKYIDLEHFIEHEKMFPSVDKQIEAEVKLDKFLQSCRTKKSEDVLQFIKEFNFPQSVGGWPVFDKSWSGNQFNLAAAVGDLKKFGVEVIISLNFEWEEPENFLRISSQDIRICKEGEIGKVLEWLNIPADSRSDLIGDCNHFEENYFATVSSVENEVTLNTTLNGLQEKFIEFDWHKYFQSVTGRDMDEDIPVLLENYNHLKNTLLQVQKLDKKIVANYLFCALADRMYAHVLRQTSCYSETFMNFHPVIHRLIRNRFYTENTKNFFLDVTKSLLDSLQSSLNVFDGETSESILKQIEQYVDKEFVSSLTKEGVNKEFEDLKIYSNSYCQNVFNLYRHKMTKLCNEFFTKNNRNLIHRLYSPQIFIQSTYHNFNKPSSVAFTLLGMPFLSDSILYYRKLHDYSDSVRECFKRQLRISKELDASDLYGIEGTEIYVNSYNEWANNNKKLVEKENEILMESGLTYKKLFFILAMQNACGYGEKENPHKIILSTLGNLNDFSDEYSCPLGSPMNPQEKCSFK